MAGSGHRVQAWRHVTKWLYGSPGSETGQSGDWRSQGSKAGAHGFGG